MRSKSDSHRYREQISKYEDWFHPEPDEVEHLLYLAREWAKLDGLTVSQNDLVKHWNDSVFPSLVKFCKQELLGLTEYCERRQADGLRTFPANKIWIIKQLSISSTFEEVEQYSVGVEGVFVADTLARIMRTSYRAMHKPGILSELTLQELRGDILEVIVRTYADLIEVMREQTKKGVEVGLTQIGATQAAINAVRKLSVADENRLEKAAKELRDKHPEWSISAIARELCKDKNFSVLSFSALRQHPRVKKFKKVAKTKGSVKK